MKIFDNASNSILRLPRRALLAPFTLFNAFGLYLTGVESIFCGYSIGVKFTQVTVCQVKFTSMRSE
ncbi:MAG: hypothetical protein MUO88_03715, partial [Desulfobacterales bacterium]|nr:hypothetical protein [Desulfobacterales bacterium]